MNFDEELKVILKQAFLAKYHFFYDYKKDGNYEISFYNRAVI